MIRLDSNVGTVLYELLGRLEGDIKADLENQLRYTGGISLEDLQQMLADQLNTGDVGAGTLVEAMIPILENVYARNILGGDILGRLRRALLIPSERAAVVAKLRQQPFACSSCGKDLGSREMVSLRQSADGVSPFLITCARCQTPILMPCSMAECGNQVEIPSAVRKHIEKDCWCEEHNDSIKREKKDGPLKTKMYTIPVEHARAGDLREWANMNFPADVLGVMDNAHLPPAPERFGRIFGGNPAAAPARPAGRPRVPVVGPIMTYDDAPNFEDDED